MDCPLTNGATPRTRDLAKVAHETAPAQDVDRMFAKTLTLVGFAVVIASIPTAVADAPCQAAPGFEAVCVAYNTVQDVQAPPLGDAGCHATVEAFCTVYNLLNLPFQDAGCTAAQGFEFVCVAFDSAPAVALPAGSTGCVTVYPYSVVCSLPPL